MGPSSTLRKGSNVIIVATDSVMQRFPHLVGQRGVVKDAPVHPVTWYKISFADGQVLTFRPSALQTIDANGVPIGPRKRPVSQLHDTSSVNSSSSGKRSLHFYDDEYDRQCGKHAKQLNYLEAESWIGKQVRILHGRMAGAIARVIGTGNGWVQLVSEGGELAKRAHELTLDLDETLYSYSESLGKENDSICLGDSKSFVEALPGQRVSRSGRVLTGPSWASSTARTAQIDHNTHNVSSYYCYGGNRRANKNCVSYCTICSMEKWEGSQFCLNEACAASPVYWKLPGSSGKLPELARACTVSAAGFDSYAKYEASVSYQSRDTIPNQTFSYEQPINNKKSQQMIEHDDSHTSVSGLGLGSGNESNIKIIGHVQVGIQIHEKEKENTIIEAKDITNSTETTDSSVTTITEIETETDATGSPNCKTHIVTTSTINKIPFCSKEKKEEMTREQNLDTDGAAIRSATTTTTTSPSVDTEESVTLENVPSSLTSMFLQKKSVLYVNQQERGRSESFGYTDCEVASPEYEQ